MKHPNIVLIFADDLGYGDLACYGSPLNRTPRLDCMAQEGLRFTDFYSASPLCSPSRAALMTGCYPERVGLNTGGRHGVLFPGDAIGLHPDEITIADLLKAAGYSTKIIGKWHLGDQPDFLPTRHGFDSYFGLPYSNDMLPDHPHNKAHSFPPLPLMKDDQVCEIDPNQASLTCRYTAEAVRFITKTAAAGKPFFLYMAHMYVHLPIHTPMNYMANSKNGVYGAAVEHLDACTGAILDTLKSLGIDDDTLVIFTSDNGSNGRNGGSNAPLRGFKGQTWEGGMREPCIMRWPAAIPAGRLCSRVTSTMDLLPTLARLAGAEPPADRTIDGRDIRHLITGDADTPHTDAPMFYYSCGARRLEAVRLGQWKLHLVSGELYDLESDIAEQNNVFDAHPAVVAELTALAGECRRDIGDPHEGIAGGNCRPAGRVDNPTTLTSMDQLDPYVRAMYDLDG